MRDWFRTVVLPEREVWVASFDDEIVGLLVLEGDWVDQLYVAREWTSQGVGFRLLLLPKQVRPRGLQL